MPSTMTVEHDLTTTELATLVQRLDEGEMLWNWITHEGRRLRYVRVHVVDGVITEARDVDHTPSDIIARAVYDALARRHARRSAAATRAAATRAQRRERRVYQVAKAIYEDDRDDVVTSHCRICGRGLADPESLSRGVGSECWQDVLSAIDRLADADPPQELAS